MKVIHKLFQTKASSVNDDTSSVDFVISTNKEDRYGDVVDQSTWNFKDYLKNPIVLWGHNPEEPENVLGTASNLSVSKDGSQTTATLNFAVDVNPKAAMVFQMIKAGVLRTVSVGFRNHSLEWDDDTPVLKDNDLLEISVVPIPANAGAVALSLKDGSIHEKDARWMLESMQKESALLEKELTANEHKEKSMTEEQATTLIEKLDAVLEENKALRERLEAQDAEAAKAAEEAAKKAEEEEAARKAEEEKKQEEDDSAKSGDDDQGGADEDELDEDAELTPEQEAEAREALGLEPVAA